MPHKSFKAVIPAAGLGTRFLPATKAMPKEMLPVVDKPAIQYVVEEAAQAGIDLIDERDPLLTTMLSEHERTGATIIALMEVDPDHIDMYGAAAVEATDIDGIVRITGLVEKPKPEEAPSNFAVI